jgi:hypothetical protein
MPCNTWASLLSNSKSKSNVSDVSRLRKHNPLVVKYRGLLFIPLVFDHVDDSLYSVRSEAYFEYAFQPNVNCLACQLGAKSGLIHRLERLNLFESGVVHSCKQRFLSCGHMQCGSTLNKDCKEIFTRD